ncbi:MAG: CheR family methyltransferase [Planctomycetota bacterium]
MSAIEERLHREIGLDVDSVGPLAIGAAVRKRMECRGLETIDQYAALLESSQAECASLIDEVVVGETWFFRDGAPFELLREQATAWRAANGGGQPLHILSVPCATGEEPYSVAMVLLDAGLKPADFYVDAVDVSGRALERAKLGEYRESSFRGDIRFLKDHYFERRGDVFVVLPEVRTSVRFHQGNLTQAHFLTGMGPYDLVFCRNLLIYLGPEARRRALDNLCRKLTRQGVLFLGHAESAAVRRPQFSPIGTPGAFAFRRSPSTEDASGPIAGSTASSGQSRRRISSARTSTQRRPNEEERPVDLHRANGDSEPRPAAVKPESLLKQATDLANQGRVKEAAKLCETYIEDHGPNAAAYYLLGLSRHAAGLIGDAEDCFRKAVYLDEEHYDALIHLALLHEQRGDVRHAANFRRRADKAASAKRGLA